MLKRNPTNPSSSRVCGKDGTTRPNINYDCLTLQLDPCSYAMQESDCSAGSTSTTYFHKFKFAHCCRVPRLTSIDRFNEQQLWLLCLRWWDDVAMPNDVSILSPWCSQLPWSTFMWLIMVAWGERLTVEALQRSSIPDANDVSTTAHFMLFERVFCLRIGRRPSLVLLKAHDTIIIFVSCKEVVCSHWLDLRTILLSLEGGESVAYSGLWVYPLGIRFQACPSVPIHKVVDLSLCLFEQVLSKRSTRFNSFNVLLDARARKRYWIPTPTELGSFKP